LSLPRRFTVSAFSEVMKPNCVEHLAKCTVRTIQAAVGKQSDYRCEGA